MAVTVRKLNDLTLYDRLSRLTFLQACELLGGREEGHGGTNPAEVANRGR